MSVQSLKMNELLKVDTNKKSKHWLDAHYNAVASLNTFTPCIDLADLHADGDYKLIIGDLGTGTYNMKLKVFKGTSMLSESSIIDLPTSVVAFHMDPNEPRTPAIAVASGPHVFIYKNLRPYFKFSLPLLEINQMEKDIWNQTKDDKIDVSVLRDVLQSVKTEGGASSLTVRSLRFLQLSAEEADAFASLHKHAPLKKQSVVTCMGALVKNSSTESGVSCLVLGSENRDVSILDPEAFTIFTKMTVASVPVFLCITGLFDVEFRILVACRDAKIYSLKKGQTVGTICIEMHSPIVGLERIGKNIVVACMDKTVTSFTNKGKKLWALHLPAQIRTISTLNHKARGFRALLVAMDNKEVRIYKENSLCDIIQTQDVVTAMKFGRYGREDATLVLIMSGGGMQLKMLKRNAKLEDANLSTVKKAVSSERLNVPKKTKLFVDQAHREKADPIGMHQKFQADLFKLQLTTARYYAKTMHTSLNPISSNKETPIKLAVQVQGFGPTFKLMLTVHNTSWNQVCAGLSITFFADLNLYTIQNPHIQLPLLIPSQEYNFETFVTCISDKGISDKIKVFVVKANNPTPVISAVVSMPVSDVSEVA